MPEIEAPIVDTYRGHEMPRHRYFIRWLMMLALLSLFSCKHDNLLVPPAGGFNAGPILFISDKSGTSQLYSMNADGSNVQGLTNDTNFAITDAKWSPDGKKIAVLTPLKQNGGVRRNGGVIYTMNSDGTNYFQVTTEEIQVQDSTHGLVSYGGAHGPVWSPDSRQLAFTRSTLTDVATSSAIFVIDIDGSNEKRVSRMMFDDEVTSWAPTGSNLMGLELDYATSKFKIVIFDFSGNHIDSLQDSATTFQMALYSTIGHKIAYTAWKDGAHNVFVVGADWSNTLQITHNESAYNYPVSWSSNDQDILIQSAGINSAATGNILIARSDASNTRNITPFSSNSLFPTSWKR
jgi:Tol biopolymer transport system component